MPVSLAATLVDPRVRLRLLGVVGLGALVVGLIGWAPRLTTPQRTTIRCQVLATGAEARSLRTQYNVLVDQGGGPARDIGLRCGTLGVVVVNHSDPLSTETLRSGDTAQVTETSFPFGLRRWGLTLSKPADLTLPETP